MTSSKVLSATPIRTPTNSFNVTSTNTPGPVGSSVNDAPESDLYQEVTALHFIHLSPRYCLNTRQGVMDHLTSLLLKYNHELQGVPLVFSRVEMSPQPTGAAIPSPTFYPTPKLTTSTPATSASILAENPQSQLWVRVRWVLFCPNVGVKVTGAVVKQSPEQLSLLLLGLFNATVKRDQLAGHLDWNDAENCWMERSGKRVGISDLVEFEVIGLKTEMGILRVVGSVDKLHTEKVLTEPTPAKSKKSKHTSSD